MLKRVGLFGIRRRINQIVKYLNDEEIVDATPVFERINERLENALWLFGVVFRYIAEVKKRVTQLEKWRKNRMTLEITRAIERDINQESIQHALEKIEELEARIVSLETENGQLDAN